MLNKLIEALPDHEDKIQTTASDAIYIVDYTNQDRTKGVELFEEKPDDIESVYLANSNEIPIYFDPFGESALPIESESGQSSMCEGVMWAKPIEDRDYWILFIEMKYSNNWANAFREENDYPRSTVKQILSTVSYFREKEIIPQHKRVHAMISFPKLVQEFNSFFFDMLEETPLQILIEHKVKLRATNTAEIRSEKRIKI